MSASVQGLQLCCRPQRLQNVVQIMTAKAATLTMTAMATATAPAGVPQPRRVEQMRTSDTEWSWASMAIPNSHGTRLTPTSTAMYTVALPLPTTVDRLHFGDMQCKGTRHGNTWWISSSTLPRTGATRTLWEGTSARVRNQHRTQHVHKCGQTCARRSTYGVEMVLAAMTAMHAKTALREVRMACAQHMDPNPGRMIVVHARPRRTRLPSRKPGIGTPNLQGGP